MITIFKNKKNNFISPCSIGGKIKKIREYRGLTQKQLGIMCGFSESTADVRIRQYENNKKVPREKAIKALAEALNIDESALFDADLLVNNMAIHALFDIEDMHSLHPVKINGHYYLDFGGKTYFGTEQHYHNFSHFLEKWFKMREKCSPKQNDTEEDIKEKTKEYDLWRYEYPINISHEKRERLILEHKKLQLEKELQQINEQLESRK